MDMIQFPDGRKIRARFAADTPGGRRFVALLPDWTIAAAAAAFDGVSPIRVTNPASGSRLYEGYTQLVEARRFNDCALVILEQPAGTAAGGPETEDGL